MAAEQSFNIVLQTAFFLAICGALYFSAQTTVQWVFPNHVRRRRLARLIVNVGFLTWLIFAGLTFFLRSDAATPQAGYDGVTKAAEDRLQDFGFGTIKPPSSQGADN